MTIFDKLFDSQKAFLAYLTAGQRGLDYTENAALALLEGGVDILEIGLPFSDPIADGPVIQEAMTDALQNKVDFQSILKMIRRIKQQRSVPIVLFTYLNPLLSRGLDQALQEAQQAGVDALLIVDLPLEESADYSEVPAKAAGMAHGLERIAGDYFKKCALFQIEPIALIAPSTEPARLTEIGRHCRSFLYYVCRNGTTGVKNNLPEDYQQKITAIKNSTKTPVVCGFGIGDKKLAQEVLEHADGFVVGSAFIRAIAEGASPEDLKKLAINIDPR